MTLNNDNLCQLHGLAGATISNDIVFNGIIYINKSCNVLILCWFNSQSEEIPSSIKTMNMKKTFIYGNFFIERTNIGRYWQGQEMFEGKCWLLYEILYNFDTMLAEICLGLMFTHSTDNETCIVKNELQM